MTSHNNLSSVNLEAVCTRVFVQLSFEMTFSYNWQIVAPMTDTTWARPSPCNVKIAFLH